jgi:quercetin dioxygenase-like cupin family protein
MTLAPHRSPRAALRSASVVSGLALLLAVSGCTAAASSDAAASSAPAPSTATASASADPTPTPTPPATDAPIVVEELGKGEQDAAVDVEVAGPTQVAFRRITIKPGAGTGEHCHAGQLVAVVEQGELTHYAPIYPGGVHVYETGDSIVEGEGYVHEGINEGTEDVVLLVTYVIAEGQPLAQTDLTQCDPLATPLPIP